MKTQIIKVTALMSLMLLLSVVSAQAQTEKRQINVPFDFYAGNAELKAGSYQIQQRAGNVMAISNAQGKVLALVNAPLTIGSRDSKPGARLVFNQYDNQYFLTQVWLQVDAGKQLFPSKAEARAAREYKLAKSDSKSKRIEVAIK